MKTLREYLIGAPIPSKQQASERLSKVRALAALAPDALSSVAYANQEIFLGLAAAGAAGLVYSWSVALAIALLLGLVAVSYTQTISAYPNGGGSYTVARENLGVIAGLVAAAALMIDYVLNVAVSVTAAVAAAASAFPVLWPQRTILALVLLVLITVANLRGLRESGAIMTVPVYLFVGVYLVMIVIGAVRASGEGPGSYAQTAPAPIAPLTLFLVLHSFAAGCTALTGVESISNGVTIFKAPQAKHAIQTMVAMAALMMILFLGTSGLAAYFAVAAGPEDTILSALARHIWGPGAMYLVTQGATLLVLTVAANTSFVDFPRVASIVAQDGFLPRQLALLGDRLVYSNSIVLLASLAGALVVVFQGSTHLLIPLFAVGAFLAFTLSQAGMVVHWLRLRGRLWPLKAGLNAMGALATLATLLVNGIAKFLDGAWLVLLLIPLLVLAFQKIRSHYAELADELSLRGLPPSLRAMPRPRIVLPISSLHRGVIQALRYAASISEQVTAVFVEIVPGSGEAMRRKWEEWGLDQQARLVVVPSPYRSVVGPFLEFLEQTDMEHNDGLLATVLMPEFVPAHWWQSFLHNQTAWAIRLALLYRRRTSGMTRAIIDVPMFLHESSPVRPKGPKP